MTTPSRTSRFDIYTWRLDTDTFTREQMEQSHDQIESLGAIIRQGSPTDATITGSPANAKARTFFYDTTNRILYYSNGTQWIALNQLSSSAPTSNSITAAGSAGTATTFSRSDHAHAGPGFGTPVSTVATTSSNAAGSASTVARSDHVHSIGAGTIVPTSLASSVAGAGITLDGSGLAVNTDNATLEVSGDVLRVKAAGLDNSHTVSTYRTIRVSSATPTGNLSAGDIWINNGAASGDYQVRQYFPGTGWASQILLQKNPGIKVSYTSAGGAGTIPVTSQNYALNYPFNYIGFPSLSTEKSIWYPTALNDVNYNGEGVIRIPFTGYYMLMANAAWRATGQGYRKLYFNRMPSGGSSYSEVDGGVVMADVNSSAAQSGGQEYTRISICVTMRLNVGDLIQLVGRQFGYPTIPTNVYWEGANASIQYVSAV